MSSAYSSNSTSNNLAFALFKEPTTKLVPVSMSALEEEEILAATAWMKDGSLSVVILGASSDLACQKAFPSLYTLWVEGLIPRDTHLFGMGTVPLKSDQFRTRLLPLLLQRIPNNEAHAHVFLSRCSYQLASSYEDVDAMTQVIQKLKESEQQKVRCDHHNRLYYLCLTPDEFPQAASTIHQLGMQDPAQGWTRLMIEKPFGRDLASYQALQDQLTKQFQEEQLYRMDHYLAKEMVLNFPVMRFSNRWLERIWNRDFVQCVMITFKEKDGISDQDGSYFDHYGIVRDVVQNHLFQVMSILAMEAPFTMEGPGAVQAVRDAKVNVLNALQPIAVDDVIIGQYEGYNNDNGSLVASSNTPTFCALRCFIHSRRWHGVPFILKAGKGLNENKVEIRVQLKDAMGAATMFDKESKCPRNEFVMTMHPKEAAYLKTNVKCPGFSVKPIQAELEIEYDDLLFVREAGTPSAISDSYTRLILDVCGGRQAHFVRSDELRRSWEILTPLLEHLEGVQPLKYKLGSRGPSEADAFIKSKAGYIRNEDYVWYDGSLARKSEGAEKLGDDNKAVADQDLCDVGLYGLAVMGQNFALNMASHGFRVCVGNRSPQKVQDTLGRAKAEGDLPIVGSNNASHFVAQLRKPRKIIILVQAGRPVDETIASLSRYMDPGDVLIDGGNEWYPNSIRRAKLLEPKGIHFIGMGISGGEEGARHGPSLMPGGPKEAYELVEPILIKCAAQVPTSGPCVGYLGPIGSGNYVKMVHNGIEYGDMQLIAEVYDILKNLCGMSNKEMAKLFESWNKGELSSYLIEITAKILQKQDDITGKGEVVDYILDKTGTKGTGKWTVQQAAEQSVAAPTIAASLDTRYLSGRKEEREEAAKILAPPSAVVTVNKKQVTEGLRMALYAAKVCSYAQGLSLIKAASDEHSWNLNLAECARLWTGGCIIRAKLLDKIQQAFSGNSSLANLMVDPSFTADLNLRSRPWRQVLALAVTAGIPCPALANSLAYFDQYRRARLPANLTQAQRDFFGGHTYERIDADGRFHTAWTDAHKDIGDTNLRTAGES